MLHVLLGSLNVEMMALPISSHIFGTNPQYFYFLSALIIAAVFDRDVNCRRAASVSYHNLAYMFLLLFGFI